MKKRLCQKHWLRIEVMTMEGFEYKNFTSKYVISTRTNGKGNIVLQSMRVLHLLFQTGYHNVEREIKRRKKEVSSVNQISGSESTSETSTDYIYGDALVDDLITNILEAV